MLLPLCMRRSSTMLQPNSSISSTYSATSSASGAASVLAAAAADPRQQGRSVLGGPASAPRSRPTPLSASSRGNPAAEAAAAAGPRSASPGMLSAAPRSVNRTPLLNKAAALEPRDDSIIVGNPAGLAVLLGDGSNSKGPANNRS